MTDLRRWTTRREHPRSGFECQEAILRRAQRGDILPLNTPPDSEGDDDATEVAVLAGTELHGAILSDQFALGNGRIQITAAIDAVDVDATGRFGMVEVSVVDGDFAGTTGVNLDLQFDTPSRTITQTQLSLFDELDVLDLFSDPEPVGSLQIEFPVELARPMPGLNIGGATIFQEVHDIVALDTTPVDFNAPFEALLPLLELDRIDISQAITATSSYLAETKEAGSVC